MRPTTTLDLTATEFVADPYPFLAKERAQHPVAWHEPTAMYLTFTHDAASAVQRDRRLGRIWKDREPTAYLQPFNLLHRHQMMETEPPEHTRLRRPVAAAFNRGHIDRLRPRVRQLAPGLLDAAEGGTFDVISAYAEPLPVLVIADLLGVPSAHVPELRQWSQSIVRMYEPAPSPHVVDDAVRAAEDFSAFIRDLVAERRARPASDLITDLVATELSEDEVVASVVLLLNAGHEASVNVFGNGLVGLLRSAELTHPRRADPPSGRVPGPQTGRVGGSPANVPVLVEEMLRFDSALQLFERTATEPVDIAGVRLESGEKIAALLGAANRDPAVFDDPDTFVADREPNPHVAFGVGVHFCLGAPLARMELAESLTALLERFPDLHLAGEPESRGTFVLRGHRSVPVAG